MISVGGSEEERNCKQGKGAGLQGPMSVYSSSTGSGVALLGGPSNNHRNFVGLHCLKLHMHWQFLEILPLNQNVTKKK